MTDCFKLRKAIQENRQLCSRISPASSISSFHEWDCSDIEQYNKKSAADETDIAEFRFENEDPDFFRDNSVAHESFRTKTKDEQFLKKPISFELFFHVDTTDLIQKLSDFIREADLDIQTLLGEQVKDPILQVVPNWIETSNTRPQKTPDTIQSKAL